MNEIFGLYFRRFVLIFFDNILVYNMNLEIHRRHLTIVLQILKNNSLFAKETKCEFGLQEVNYLGHLINYKGVSTDRRK
jgi:Reverse transcriptase (RNA-dependent DNA polymerase)